MIKEFAEFELTKEFRDRFQEALDQRDGQFILESLKDIDPADITALLYEFNAEESKYVLDLLPMDIRALIIKDLDSETRISFLKIYTTGELVGIINQVDSDDAADILNELAIQVREEVIVGLEPELRGQVIDLLRYEENV